MLQNTQPPSFQQLHQQIDHALHRITMWQAVISTAQRNRRQAVGRGNIEGEREAMAGKREGCQGRYLFEEVGGGGEELQGGEGEWGFVVGCMEECRMGCSMGWQVQTRHNWIERYLDYDGAQVIVWIQEGRYRLLRLGQSVFEAEQMSTCQSVSIPCQQVYNLQHLTVKFPRHRMGCHLHTQHNHQKHLYQLQLTQQQRIIVQIIGDGSEMNRLIVLKQVESGYEVVWGNYSTQTFQTDLILQQGKYILLPLVSHQRTLIINLYSSAQHPPIIRTAIAHTPTTYQLLTSAFSECRGSDLSVSAVTLTEVKQSYARSCYLDLGVVVQVYENIYPYECLFLEQSSHKEDLQLLLPEIYGANHLQNRLEGGQRVVKFYSISARPARMFIPHKQVLMGSRIMENITFHTIFK